MDTLAFPHLADCMLRFFLVDVRIAALCLWVRKQVLTVVCVYVLNNSLEYPANDSLSCYWQT